MPILKEPIIKEKSTILTNSVQIRDSSKPAFLDWQAKMNTVIAGFPGFVSLEILADTDLLKNEWVIVQRFSENRNLLKWYESDERRALLEELEKHLVDSPGAFIEQDSLSSDIQGGVTEVFVTQINPEREGAYRAWMSKIHQVEAKFPGFRGCYVQSPREAHGKNWITLLQFDTPENLDRWLASKERQEIIKESTPLITSLESHRVISPYGGWFSSIAKKGELPPVWKQSMIVLLMLFPIVMFEFKFLSPLTASLNISLSTFIGNAISVTLLAWPFVPIAIWLLGWWLAPEKKYRTFATIFGTILVLGLYLAEIALFWRFL